MLRRMGQLLAVIAATVAISLLAGLAVCAMDCHADEAGECVCLCHESVVAQMDQTLLPETPFVGFVCWLYDSVESDWCARIFRPPIA